MTEIFDVAIVGSGPAGLTAGIYASRANLKTVLFAGEKWGGQLMLTTMVENYPGFPEGIEGPQLMENMKSQAEKFGVKIIYEKTEMLKQVQHDIFKIKTINSEFFSKSVIIATGADTQWLNLPNEQRLIGHGVSSCAPCDAFFFKNKKVAVVGGGDSACEEALFLTKFATEVTIIHRRDQLRASKIMQDRVFANPKIKILFNTEIVDVLGKDNVEALSLRSTVNSEQVSTVNFDGIFIAVGHKKNDELLRELDGVDGVFVAGDVIDLKYKQAVTAAASGCIAAMDCEKWLENNK